MNAMRGAGGRCGRSEEPREEMIIHHSRERCWGLDQGGRQQSRWGEITGVLIFP